MKHGSSVTVYIGVGSNIDADENIVRAFELLGGSLVLTAVSPFFRSAAAGGVSQPDFLNGVFAASTALGPRVVKYDVLRVIEEKLGRRRTADKNAPRPIDLDLVLYNALIIDEPGLTVPDPGLTRYPFVALPLLALAPDIIEPVSGRALRDFFPQSPDEYGLIPLPRLTAELLRRLNQPKALQADQARDGGPERRPEY